MFFFSLLYCSFSITCYSIVTVTVGTPASNPESNAEIQQPNVSAGVYVPPSLRKQQQASSLRKQQAYKTKKVPDITSQQAFPSLQPSVQNKDSRYHIIKSGPLIFAQAAVMHALPSQQLVTYADINVKPLTWGFQNTLADVELVFLLLLLLQQPRAYIYACYYSSTAAEDQSKETQQHQINMARGIREPIIEHHNRYTALSES